jgi:D-alanine-D-alanine ligase
LRAVNRVAVLYGGVSGEHEVSVASARSVIAALRSAGYQVLPILIDRDGEWRTQPEGTPVALGRHGRLLSLALGAAQRELEPVEFVFPVLHGTMGEDGTIQGMLEILEVPYAGAGVLGSALGMDKIVMKRLFRVAGLRTVDFVACTRQAVLDGPEAVADEIEAALRYPVFTKPSNLGSSVGVSKAGNRDELLAALALAARYDRRVIVEQGVDAREIETSVLGNDEPIATVPGEVIPGRDFYDYEAKYGDAGSLVLAPANLDEALVNQVREWAVRAFLALDLAGFARVDFLLERNTGMLYISEVNTIPGFTEISMFAKLWQASGLSLPELVDRIVALGLERFADKQRSLSAAREETIAS